MIPLSIKKGTILVIDMGLTNCKVILFDARGNIVGRAVIPYPTYRPGTGLVEQQPLDWWVAIKTGLDELCQIPACDLESVCAISITAHMHSLVCVGKDGSPLGPSLVLGDQRSRQEAHQIEQNLGTAHIYRLTGARMDASMPIAKIAWLQKNAPEQIQKTQVFMACKDWIRQRMTNDRLTDPVDACGTSIYDLQQRSWSPELMTAIGIRPDQMPQVIDPCSLAGKLLPDAARDLGLRSGIPVVVGAGDDVEVLGNGLVSAGVSLEHLGTTGSILTCATQPIYDPEMGIELYPHVIPGLWVLGGSVTSAGSALAWMQNVLRLDGDQASLREVRAPDIARPLVFVPHLSGERCPAWVPQARGSWLGITPEHTSGDLSQAAWEGVIFSLKGVLQRLDLLAGYQERVTISSRDQGAAVEWLRASIYDRPLGVLNTSEPTALGAMMLAAVAVGLFKDLYEAVAQVTAIQETIHPQTEWVHAYRRLYELYKAAADATRSVMLAWEV